VRLVAAVAALLVVVGATGRAASPRQSFGVVLDAKTGRRLATVRLNQPIRTAIADGHGAWFIGGGFIRANGVLRKRLARVGPDGRLDPLWKPEANGNGVSVTSLARIGGRVYVGGDFVTLQHRPRLWVGAFGSHSGRLLPWKPLRGGINYPVLLTGPDRVYLGGYGVQATSGLAALRAVDGRPAPEWHAILDTSNIEGGGVRAIARLDGRLYIAGRFTKVDGVPTPGLAALDARSGRLFRDWRPPDDRATAAGAPTCPRWGRAAAWSSPASRVRSLHSTPAQAQRAGERASADSKSTASPSWESASTLSRISACVPWTQQPAAASHPGFRPQRRSG
jgi:hypothetical protein